MEVVPIRHTLDSTEGILDLLTAFQPGYSELKQRHERSSINIDGRTVCGDPRLDFEYRAAEKNMNDLLDQYQAHRVGAAAVDGVQHQEIIAEHTERVLDDGRGSN